VIKVNINIIEACSDLGTHVDGSELGPIEIVNNLNTNKIANVYKINKVNTVKSKDKADLEKNLDGVNEFTKNIFNQVSSIIKNNGFPLTIGGDHSVVIGSILASNKLQGNLGVIWIDAHGDYNTFETTHTGNLHGLPFAAVSGYNCDKLTNFVDGLYVNPKNCVVVGARSIDPWEIGNIKDAGVTVFTTEDIKLEGARNIMNKAIKIASNNTNGIHISYDLDVIDPLVAPGVSIPEENGINEDEAYLIMDEIIDNIELVKSMDLVEYNPTRDKNDVTRDIGINLINNIVVLIYSYFFIFLFFSTHT
jgi:arginase